MGRLGSDRLASPFAHKHRRAAGPRHGCSWTKGANTGTGVLTLTGTDTVAHYQQVLRTAAYSNSSAAPSDANRTIEFRVNDVEPAGRGPAGAAGR